MKQADAARKVFRELACNLDELPRWTECSSGSEYSHKLVSCLFSRDNKMKAEVEDLKSKLTPDQIKIFRQQMSLRLDQMFEENITQRKRDVATERRIEASIDRRTPEQKEADEKFMADFWTELEAWRLKNELENPTPPPAATHGRRKCYRAKAKPS